MPASSTSSTNPPSTRVRLDQVERALLGGEREQQVQLHRAARAGAPACRRPAWAPRSAALHCGDLGGERAAFGTAARSCARDDLVQRADLSGRSPATPDGSPPSTSTGS